jgi:hypothetical protein
MLERKVAITNEVLEPITFVLEYPRENEDFLIRKTVGNIRGDTLKLQKQMKVCMTGTNIS